VAVVVDCLPSMGKALSSTPITPKTQKKKKKKKAKPHTLVDKKQNSDSHPHHLSPAVGEKSPGPGRGA
jgi:hypothetical protein